MWNRPKKKDGVSLKVADDAKTKHQVLKEFYDTIWAYHRGI